ncbi:MAG: hypothetical protein ACMZI0_03080, partial [Symbiopectobacterium sp.]
NQVHDVLGTIKALHQYSNWYQIIFICVIFERIKYFAFRYQMICRAIKGTTYAAEAMASLTMDLLQNPALVAQAKAELAEKLSVTPFENPIPDGVVPPIPQV